MPLVIPVGYGECGLRFRLANDPEDMFSFMGYRPSDLSTTALSLLTAGTNVGAAFQASIFPAGAADMSDDYTMVGYRLTFNSSDAGVVTVDIPDLLVGTQAIQSLPQNACLIVKKQTALGGRKHRGRMFLPPYGISSSTTSPSGITDNTTTAAFQTRFDDWLADVNTNGVDLILLHSSALTTPDEVTSLVVDNLIATQRRRLRH